MRAPKNRSRNKNNRNKSVGNIINRNFESSGPDGKVRGTPQQIIDKYSQSARDAQLNNDNVAAENFMQHAEHYIRILAEAQRESELRREQQERDLRERQKERERQDHQVAAIAPARNGDTEAQVSSGFGLDVIETGDGDQDAASAPLQGFNAAPTDGNDQPSIVAPKESAVPKNEVGEEKAKRKPRAPRKPRATAKDKVDAEVKAPQAPPKSETQEAAE